MCSTRRYLSLKELCNIFTPRRLLSSSSSSPFGCPCQNECERGPAKSTRHAINIQETYVALDDGGVVLKMPCIEHCGCYWVWFGSEAKVHFLMVCHFIQIILSLASPVQLVPSTPHPYLHIFMSPCCTLLLLVCKHRPRWSNAYFTVQE